MSIDPKWLTREKWTLVEAALICGGVEPYAGGPTTDNPNELLKRIDDADRRELFTELYSRSKDAISGNTLALGEASRTGYDGNKRVRSSEYVIWAFDLPLPSLLSALVDMDALRPVFGPPLPSRPDDSLIETGLGYTIDGAAKALAERYDVDTEPMCDRIRAAVIAGDLKLIDPKTRLPFPAGRPQRGVRDFDDRIRTADLDAWFKKEGSELRLGGTARVEGALIQNKRSKPDPWQIEARLIADELHLRDAKAGLHDSLPNLSDRVAKLLRERGVKGPRGPVRGSTVMRESASRRSLERQPAETVIGRVGKRGSPSKIMF